MCLRALLTSVFVIASLCVITSSAFAYDIAGYRSVSARANDPKNTEDRIARLSLTGYHQGIAETLQMMRRYNKGEFTLNGAPVICIPESASFSAEFIKGLMESELRKPEIYRAHLGPDWEKHFAFSLVFVALTRLFPCQ